MVPAEAPAAIPTPHPPAAAVPLEFHPPAVFPPQPAPDAAVPPHPFAEGGCAALAPQPPSASFAPHVFAPQPFPTGGVPPHPAAVLPPQPAGLGGLSTAGGMSLMLQNIRTFDQIFSDLRSSEI